MATTLGLFENTFFTEILLPFLLVFVVVFAILEKTGILGDNKKAANIIVGIIIGLIFVGVSSVVGVTMKIIPIVALILVILLCVLILFGFVGIDITKEGKVKGIKIALGIILGLTMIGTILWALGIFDKIQGPISPEVIQYILIFVIIGGAIALAVSTSKKHTTTTTDKT